MAPAAPTRDKDGRGFSLLSRVPLNIVSVPDETPTALVVLCVVVGCVASAGDPGCLQPGSRGFHCFSIGYSGGLDEPRPNWL